MGTFKNQINPEREAAFLKKTAEMRAYLDLKVPNLNQIPVIYWAGGGDLITPIKLFGSKRTILVGDVPFLAFDDGYRVFNSFEDTWEYSDQDPFELGFTVINQAVRPAVQMASTLKRLGVPKEDVTVTVFENGDMIMTFYLEDQYYVVEYYSTKIKDIMDMYSMVHLYDLKHPVGMLIKGSAQIGKYFLEYCQAGSVLPEFFVMDDPRSYYYHQAKPLVYDTLSTQEEAQTFFPIYKSVKSFLAYDGHRWGYSYEYSRFEGHYSSRVVIGTLSS